MLRLIALLVLLLCRLALADGLIIIHDPPRPIPGHFHFAPLEVNYHRVDVEINDNIATTSIDQEFRNPSSQRLEGTYIFPLPENAHIDKFAMDVNGSMQEAELLDADKARKLYEEIVRKQKDPALLEYIGRGAFKVRIFPIEPNSKKQIKIKYTQLLKSDNGLSEYIYPLNTEKFSSRPLEEVSVKVRVKTDRPLKTIHCPSHNADVRRDGERSAVIAYEDRHVRPDTDFRVVFTQAQEAVDIRLLTYRTSPGEDGYFMLMASPGFDDKQRIQERDICFVVDTSGSMAGEKIRQARKALRFCVDNLNEGDRFQIIRFSTEAQALWDEMKPASDQNRQEATKFIDSFKPMGGTAIEDALRKALGTLDDTADNRPAVIVFLTDGQPTVGETKEDKLVDLLDRKAKGSRRIFTFGIGDDINTHLLDRIAEKTNAYTTYVGAKEDLELKVSTFYTGIQSPVLSDLALSFSGSNIRVHELMPGTLPDLFRGQTLHVFGRYSGSGPAAATLKGELNGETKRLTEDVRFEERDDSREYIAQLWATRRVGWLLDEIRLRGESRELREEVTRLAREFGIVTPYTAYLILEDEQRRHVPQPLQSMRELGTDSRMRREVEDMYLSNRADVPQSAVSGPRGVQNAQTMQQLKEAAAVGAPVVAPALQKPATEPQGYRAATNFAQQARVVNGRAFYQNGAVWTDATAQNNTAARQQLVRFGSDEYFALLRQDRNLAAWLSLGSEVDVMHDGVLYQIRN